MEDGHHGRGEEAELATCRLDEAAREALLAPRILP